MEIIKRDNLELRYCEDGLDEIVTNNIHIEKLDEGTVCITFQISDTIVNIFAIKKGKIGINIL